MVVPPVIAVHAVWLFRAANSASSRLVIISVSAFSSGGGHANSDDSHSPFFLYMNIALIARKKFFTAVLILLLIVWRVLWQPWVDLDIALSLTHTFYVWNNCIKDNTTRVSVSGSADQTHVCRRTEYTDCRVRSFCCVARLQASKRATLDGPACTCDTRHMRESSA